MKRLMVIVAMIFSSVYMFASELIVKGNIDAPFSLFINGEKYYSYNHAVTISNIPSGTYSLEIYTEGDSYELLYDYSITIPFRSTVLATFSGDDKMYITTEKDAPARVVYVTPYPHRITHPTHHHAPVHHVAPIRHGYAPAPKHEMHNPKSDNHHKAETGSKPRNDVKAPSHNARNVSATPKNHNEKAAKPSTHNHSTSRTSSHSSSKPTRSSVETRR